MNLQRLYLISTLIMVFVTAIQVTTYALLYQRDNNYEPIWKERIEDTESC